MTPAEVSAFGRHVRLLRQAHGLTQVQLAERSGVSPDSIYRLERGKFSPTVRNLSKVAKGLDMGMGTIMLSFDLTQAVSDRRLVDALVARLQRDLAVGVDLIRRGWHERRDQ